MNNIIRYLNMNKSQDIFIWVYNTGVKTLITSFKIITGFFSSLPRYIFKIKAKEYQCDVVS